MPSFSTLGLRSLVCVLTLGALLTQIGCSASEESITFAAITTAADALVAGLAISGNIPGSDVASATLIASAAIRAAQQTTAEEGSQDSVLQKSTAVAGYWAVVVVQMNTLPIGSPITHALLALLAGAIQNYLNAIAPTATLAPAAELQVKHGMASLHFKAMLKARSLRYDLMRARLNRNLDSRVANADFLKKAGQ